MINVCAFAKLNIKKNDLDRGITCDCRDQNYFSWTLQPE